jgi:drug/metabolite transporter (DMT)-like permease
MFPVIGVGLGVIFLGESLDVRLVIGALLVVAGIGVVNWKPPQSVGDRSTDQVPSD